MPATDAIDAAALGKHSYMHCKILTEILNAWCLLYSFFLIAASVLQVTVCICYRSK